MARRPRLPALAITLAIAFVAPTALAQGQHGPREGAPNAPDAPTELPRFLDQEVIEALALDEAQAQMLDALSQELDQDLELYREDLEDIRSQIAELWASGAPSQEEVLVLGEWEDVLIASIREREIDFRLDVLEILSLEQRALVAEMTAEGEEGEDDGRRRGRRGGDEAGSSEWTDETGADEGRRGRRGGGSELGDDGDRGPRGGNRGGFDEAPEDDFGEAEGRGRRASGENGRRGGLARRLDLDDWQRDEVATLRAEQRERDEPILQLRDELRQEMRALWATELPDVEAILEVGEDLDVLRAMLRESRVDFRLALIELLTLEQQELYAEMSERGPSASEGRPGRLRPMRELGRQRGRDS